MKMTALAAAAVLAVAPDFTRSPGGEQRGYQPQSKGERSAAFEPSTYDAETRTVELILSVGAQVERWGFNEELEISADAIDLSRVEGGKCPLLNSHNRWSIGDILGQVLESRIEDVDGQPGLVAKVRFADTEAGREAEGMVSRGELRGVSIGYRVRKWALVPGDDPDDTETWRATSWVLMEASLVAVPADAGAGVRSDPAPTPETNPTKTGARAEQEDTSMLKTKKGLLRGTGAPALAPNDDQGGGEPRDTQREAVRTFTPSETVAFLDQARAMSVETRGKELIEKVTAGEVSPDAARAALLEAAAEAQAVRTAPAAGGAARVTEDARDKQRSAIENVLLHRVDSSVKVEDGARQYMGMSLAEIGRRHLEANGERVAGLNKREIAGLMLRQQSTSDFPSLFTGVANRSMRKGYDEAVGSHKQWMKKTTISDFRPIERSQMSAAPSLMHVPEGGEYKYGSFGEGKEVYQLGTYGRLVAFTRQAIVNDDLSALADLPFKMGAAAARFETDLAYAQLLANANMSDGKALFHADHGNLGSATALSEAGLTAADAAMGSQTGLQGEALNITPKYLIVSRKDAVAARKLITSVTATKTGDVNVFADSYELIVEQRLNGLSGGTNPWFLAADPAQIDTVEYAYLEGDEGVYLEQREGWNVDGIEWKVRLDVAAKAIDWRGLYKNPGA